MDAFLCQQHHTNFFLEYSPTNIDMSFLPHHHQSGGGEQSNASASCFTSRNNSPASSLEKKRKQSDGNSCLSTGQSKGVKGSTMSRSKKANEEKKAKAMEVVKATNEEEPPSGYIHVRARRGQATDSHSLAERVRRERISERMKKLQGLVPGCDKVIGKALVLDEIINYVQSLQNQVEFLSMKLASVNPILYDFRVAFEDYMSQEEEMGSTSQPMPFAIHSSHIPATAFDAATNSLQQQQPIDPFPLHGQGNPSSFPQCSGSFLMQVELNDMCSFQ